MSGTLQQLQDSSLNTLCSEQVAAAVYLVNRIKVRDHVLSFDRDGVLLKSSLTQMVSEHATSTVLPAGMVNAATLMHQPRPVRIPGNEGWDSV